MRRDILSTLWRFFGSRRLTLVLLTVTTLVISLSAAFPQMPRGMTIGSSEYSHWNAEIRARYLQWAAPLESLGLFNVFGSLWLRLPLALLILNLAVCAVEQFEVMSLWSKYAAKEFDEAFRQASVTFEVSGTVNHVVSSLHAFLEDHRYKVEIQQREEDSYLTAVRFSLTRWGTLLAHGGLIVAIVGLLLGGSVAWTEEGIALDPGQVYQLQHASSLSLRLDDFQAELYPDGTPHSYRAQLTLLEEDAELATTALAPNAPFIFRGIAFYLRSHGPAIKIKGLGARGEPISLQALVPGGTPQEEVTLQLGEEQNEGYVAAPEHNLMLRFVFHPQLQTDTGERPALLVQAYRGGVTDLGFSDTLFGSASLPIEGNLYDIEWRHYAVLAVARNPSTAPQVLGSACLLAGAIIALYLPPRYLWAVVSGKEGMVETRLVAPGQGDKRGDSQEFQVLMGDINKYL